MAGANTFRTFADKLEVDYSQKEQKFSKTEMVVEEAEKQHGAENFEKSDALNQSKEAVEISIKQKEKIDSQDDE